MAKGNLFLGTGINSVGDVTLMRRNGAQVARVRVRQIANPKSDGQATQRMYVAAVPKFYSPLSVALEKSWEGKNKQDSYSAFLKENISILKTAGYAIPKGTGFYPIPAKVSHGTLATAEVSQDDASVTYSIALGQAGVATMGALSEALINKYGLKDGDQVTFIGVLQIGSNDPYYVPIYERWFLDSTSTDPVQDMGQFVLSINGSSLLIGGPDDNIASFGCIFSRYENGLWRRSTSRMLVNGSLYAAAVSTAQRQSARETYQDQATTPVSNVYLNGSTAQEVVSAVTLRLANGEEVAVTSIQQVQGEFISGETTENAPVYQLKSADNQTYFLKNDNQRSDYYGMPFMPNAEAETIYQIANLQGVTAANTLLFDSNADNAATEKLWAWMQSYGVSIVDLNKFFPPSL